MKVQELMERVGDTRTGLILAYLKDGLKELNRISEVNVNEENIDLALNQRYYHLPRDMVKIIDVRVKNHLNTKDEYRSIPRMVGKPLVPDADNN
tara:strand:+ start:8162 stop:8443 length:282 start_codon:yes stop_codon:yes gene_type:complete